MSFQQIYFILKSLYTKGEDRFYLIHALDMFANMINQSYVALAQAMERKENVDMTQQNLEQLIRIYNTLLLVGTKGDDTILMGDCLKALKHELEEMQASLAQTDENNVVIEDIKE